MEICGVSNHSVAADVVHQATIEKGDIILCCLDTTLGLCTCTVLCKSNASEMREFRSLFLRTFLESSRDNSRLFERNFPTTKSAISSKFLYQTKVRRKFEVKSVVSSTSARNFALVRQNNSLRDIFDLLVM